MAKNPCLRCICRVFRALPVLFILMIVLWSYYAYVVVFCIDFVHTTLEKVLYLIFYHLLLFIFLWSFLKAVLARPIRPPHDFFLSADDWTQINNATDEQEKNRILEAMILNRKLPVEMTSEVGNISVCPKCSVIKPDRCHHCSTCECCLLKMDHHCPWIDNCVGFHNYKFFIVFLFWGTAYCLYIFCTNIYYFVDFWENVSNVPPTRYNFVFLFFVAIMFGCAQLILLVYHIYLLSNNRTTLEGFQAPTFRGIGVDKRGFDLGWRGNWAEVLGDNCVLGMLPVFTSRGNGYQWRRRGHKGFSYQSLE